MDSGFVVSRNPFRRSLMLVLAAGKDRAAGRGAKPGVFAPGVLDHSE